MFKRAESISRLLASLQRSGCKHVRNPRFKNHKPVPGEWRAPRTIESQIKAWENFEATELTQRAAAIPTSNGYLVVSVEHQKGYGDVVNLEHPWMLVTT